MKTIADIEERYAAVRRVLTPELVQRTGQILDDMQALATSAPIADTLVKVELETLHSVGAIVYRAAYQILPRIRAEEDDATAAERNEAITVTALLLQWAAETASVYERLHAEARAARDEVAEQIAADLEAAGI